jgi:ESCRT-II complex subunit VPS36
MDQLQPEGVRGASEQADNDAELEKGLTLIEIAAMEGLPIGLAKELMEEVEKLGHSSRRTDTAGGIQPYGLVRDDQAEQGAGGIRWYRDLISSWEL